jgi:GT2 family glycosyltransferase
MKTTIITPLFNRADLTIEFIKSLSKYITVDTEIIFIDNNSSDSTLQVVSGAKKLYKLPITVVSNHKNLGFGTANNIGAKLAKGENLIFISNDVKILGDFITPMVEYLEQHNNRAVGPRLIREGTGWNDCFIKIQTGEDVGVIPYLEGFCFALRKDIFLGVGGFPEEIFIDYEDLFLSYKLRLMGVGLSQINLPLQHELGGSFGGLSDARIKFTKASQQIFMDYWGFKLK